MERLAGQAAESRKRPRVIPFLHYPDAFRPLVAIAVVVGHFVFLRRAGRQGMDKRAAASLSFCAILAGFVGSHLLKMAYDPIILAQGWKAIVNPYNGMSSFGGLAGGLAGMLLYFRARRVSLADRWRFADAMTHAFIGVWVIGRAGCVLGHDHPGIRSERWFAVDYPGGPRLDLAVIEVVFFIVAVWPLAGRVERRTPPPGRVTGAFLTLYGVFRLALDQLHDDPPRYLSITVDQWAASGCLLAGVAILVHSQRQARLARRVAR